MPAHRLKHTPLKGDIVSKWFEQLKSPLVLNGYALVLSSGATSVLGVVYWIVAARLYSEQAVGLSSATLAAMFFLANVSQFNLVDALNRFVPSAGRSTARLVLTAYLVSIVMAVAASVIFLLGIRIWTPSLSVLNSSPTAALWFVFATVSWCLFALQDSVLIGLRQSKWVPLENILYAAAKIGLIVLFATTFPAQGVFISWTAPLWFLILPVNGLIFFRLIPAHVRATERRSRAVVPKDIIRFIAGDYLSSLVWMATVTLLPIMILERVGASSSAYFYLSWNIAYTLYLISLNMGMSLVTEGVRDEDKLNLYSFQVLRQTLRLMVPVVALVFVGAPYILRLYGESYAAEGVTLLRLLSLSALPYVVVAIYLSMARVKRDVRALFFVLSGLSVLVLGLTHVFLGVYGIMGIGLAWLLAQSAVMIVLLVTQLRRIWLPQLELSDFSTLFKLPALAAPVKKQLCLAHARKLMPQVKRQLEAGSDAQAWRVKRLVLVSDVKIVTLGVREEVALLKVPMSHQAETSLAQHAHVVATLGAKACLGEWRRLLPELLVEPWDSQSYWVESKLPGVKMEKLLLNPETRSAALRLAALRRASQMIATLHSLTEEWLTVDAAVLETWVDAPLRRVRKLVAQTAQAPQVELLAAELSALRGRRLLTSWVHGDYSPQTILLRGGGSGGVALADLEITGIIGWEAAAPQHPPLLDLIHLLVSTEMLVERQELGAVVCAMLTPPGRAKLERSLAQLSQNDLSAVDLRTFTLLFWLRHIQNSVTTSRRCADNASWIANNVECVLACIAQSRAKNGPGSLVSGHDI